MRVAGWKWPGAQWKDQSHTDVFKLKVRCEHPNTYTFTSNDLLHQLQFITKMAHKKIKPFFFIYIQNHAILFCTQTALKESSFYVACWFLFMVFSSINGLQKKRHRINVWYHYLITLESKLGIEKNRNW